MGVSSSNSRNQSRAVLDGVSGAKSMSDISAGVCDISDRRNGKVAAVPTMRNSFSLLRAFDSQSRRALEDVMIQRSTIELIEGDAHRLGWRVEAAVHRESKMSGRLLQIFFAREPRRRLP